MAIRERGIIDADVAFGQASDQARLVQGDAAAVMRAADAAQYHPRVGTGIARSRPRLGRREGGVSPSSNHSLPSTNTASPARNIAMRRTGRPLTWRPRAPSRNCSQTPRRSTQNCAIACAGSSP
jgi:hypothetical protein